MATSKRVGSSSGSTFKTTLAAGWLGVCLALGASSAYAQRDAIQLVVGAPPGGTTDTVARGIAQHMSKSLGRTVLVENKPGAGGNIASDYVAKSAPDGNKLLVSFTSFSINASLFKNLPFDPINDFTPISMLANVPSVLVTRTEFPADNIAELIELVKASPGKYTTAVGSMGSSLHMAGERFKMMTGLEILNIPYKGTAPAVTDLLGGQVDMMFGSALTVVPHIKSGKLKAIGVTSPGPLAHFPGVAPIGETVPGFESNAWFAVFGPAGMPPETVEALNKGIREAVATPGFTKLLETESSKAISSTPQELADFVSKDIALYADIVKFTNATTD